MYERFALVLMVNHACNLRCTYCYTGAKFRRSMRAEVGRAALTRAVLSIREGGTLELGFFGGEPLIEANLITDLIDYAQEVCHELKRHLVISMTTNGTVTGRAAWRVMMMPQMQLSVSHDGLPEVHDRHRRSPAGGATSAGRPTAARVLATIQRLLDAGREPRVTMVVRPDTVSRLPDGIAWLRRQGIRQVDPSLDLWARWDHGHAELLLEAVANCADLWRDGLPHHSIGWFDEKVARLTGVPTNATARCGFGNGQIAVAPSGNLYPCERLIGEDAADNPMRLPGHAFDARIFRPVASDCLVPEPCSECAIQSQCSTFCRCSNYIRTGDPSRPDGLLCLLDKASHRETVRVLRTLQTAPTSTHGIEGDPL